MKALDIALKDLLQSSRSAFALIFMFGIPLLITLLFSFMFGGFGGEDEGFTLPQTVIVVANLDEGDPNFESNLALNFQDLPFDFDSAGETGSLGDMLVQILKSPGLADLWEVTEVGSFEAAKQAVDDQEAGVAVLIPGDLSASFSESNAQTSISLYQDPTLTFGPAIVQSVMNQFIDQLSATKIAVNLVINQAGGNPSLIGQVIQKFLEVSMKSTDPQSWIIVQSPAAREDDTGIMAQIVGPIMGGMMIFYAFYSGFASSQTILEEEEKGTLPRLFSTPTPSSTILSGKFLAVLLTVVVQVVVLMVLGRYVFRIHWGALGGVSLVAAGIVLSASTFGIFVNSLLKTARQGGIVYGAVLTMTGMLGMLRIFTLGSGNNPTLRLVSFLVPQGWAVEGLLNSMSGSGINLILPSFLVLLAWSALFFILGVLRFRKRYA